MRPPFARCVGRKSETRLSARDTPKGGDSIMLDEFMSGIGGTLMAILFILAMLMLVSGAGVLAWSKAFNLGCT